MDRRRGGDEERWRGVDGERRRGEEERKRGVGICGEEDRKTGGE